MSATDHLAALDAVLRATNADFDGAAPDAQAFFRRELATALKAAGFVHLDRALIDALRRGMRSSKASGNRARESEITREPPVTLHSEADDLDVLDDAEPLDALDEMEGATAETVENVGDGEEPPG